MDSKEIMPVDGKPSSQGKRSSSNLYQRKARRKERLEANLLWISRKRPRGVNPILETRSLNMQVSKRLMIWLDLYAEFVSTKFPEAQEVIHHGSILEGIVPSALRKEKIFIAWVRKNFPQVVLDSLDFAESLEGKQ